MKTMLRLALLVGIFAMFLTAAPGNAAVDCSLRDGQPCTQQGAKSNCTWYDDGSGCFYLYPCWCDRAFGPLQWRCGPNPTYVSCPVANDIPSDAPPAQFASWLSTIPETCLPVI